VKAYQERGEARLRNRVIPARIRRKLPGPVREKNGEIKKREFLLGQANFPSIEACVLPQCKPGDCAADAESLIVRSKEKHK
jgi:hypothetical protein